MSGNYLEVDVEWQEGARLRATARGTQLTVDKIHEDGRRGSGFRPTELILAGLGACTMGTLLTFCENMDIPVEKFAIRLRGKREHQPERMSEIHLALSLEGDISEDRIETLKRVAKGCRVHYTLTHPPRIEVDLEVTRRPADAPAR